MTQVSMSSPVNNEDFFATQTLAVAGMARGTPGNSNDQHPKDSALVASVLVGIDGLGQEASQASPGAMQTSFTSSFALSAVSVGFHWLNVRVTDDQGGEAFTRIPFFVGDPLGCLPAKAFTNYGQNILETTPQLTCQPVGLDDIVTTIQRAEAAGQRVHAAGSHWSFSECAVPFRSPDGSPQVLIETRGLNQVLPPIDGAVVAGAPLAVHVQAGITIEELYNRLNAHADPVSGEWRPLALETMPATTGQTLAGAISTGSHGGDVHQAPLADSVLAVHLVGAGGTQYWIEPSAGITNPALLRNVVDFGTTTGIEDRNIIYDDALFNAVIVSLGCMGIIYGLVLRVREQYNLVETTIQTTWQQFVQNGANQITDTTNRFLQVALSPYPDANGQNPCLVTTRVEGARLPNRCSGDVQPALAKLKEHLRDAVIWHGDWTAGDVLSHLTGPPDAVLQQSVNYILRSATELRPVLTGDYFALLAAGWPPVTCGGASYEVMDTNLRGAGAAGPTVGIDTVEVHLPSVDAQGGVPFVDVVNHVLTQIAADNGTFFAGYISLRFTSGSRAYLAMQQSAHVCAVEMSTLRGIDNLRGLLTQCVATMQHAGGRPHWGQMVDLVPGHTVSMYPMYDAWRDAYARLSEGFTRRTFENDLSIRWELTVPDLTAAATPTINTNGTQTPDGQVVIVDIADTTPGSSIYWTLNGTPDPNSNRYNGEFTLPSGSGTLNAIAVAPGYTPSAIATVEV